MKRIKLILLVCVIALPMLTGCIFKTKEPWCEKIPKDSYSVLCEIADHFGVQPENVASLLKVGNAVALSKGQYVAESALRNIDELIEMVQEMRDTQKITYNSFVLVMTAKYHTMPPEVRAIFVILDDYVNPDIVVAERLYLSEYDFTGILHHLNDQRNIIQLFKGKVE